jgi:hypothetical protein
MTETPDRPAAPTPGPPRTPRPGPPPGPRPGPRPRAAGSEGAGAPEPAAPPRPPASDPSEWGRVDEEGNVYCRTGDGERHVGQTPDMAAEDALAFFGRKYDELSFEIGLLRQRVQSGHASPDDAAKALKLVRAQVAGARVVGDLAALDAELATVESEVAGQREQRKARRAEQLAAARTEKERIVTAAEGISTGTDWRHGADKLRSLLEQWKALPRLDKPTDDELWHRFSSARTAYTRRRKSHFAEQSEQREAAKKIKLTLIKEAEALSGSTDWGPTSGAYRQLMRRWKEAGPAPRDVDDQLWQRFRAAQDVFFTARDEATKATDAEFAANAKVKEKLVTDAEALLPITDLQAAKTTFRSIADKWDAAGKVPRERVRELEGRMRKVEQALRSAEDARWQRSNPEARARAADTVAQLEASILELQRKADRAEASGDARSAQQHATAIEARQQWLEQARKALDEFSG